MYVEVPVPTAELYANLSIAWSHLRLKRISEGILNGNSGIAGMAGILGRVGMLLGFFSSDGASDIFNTAGCYP